MRWKFQISYFFKCLISSFNFHFDRMHTFARIRQKRFFPPYDFTPVMFFGLKILMNETKSIRWTETVSRVNTFNDVSPSVYKAINRAHFIARKKKTLQYRLELLWRTFQSKTKHTSLKANRKISVRTQGCQYCFHCPISFNLSITVNSTKMSLSKFMILQWVEYNVPFCSILTFTYFDANKHDYFEWFTKAFSIRPYWIIVIILHFINFIKIFINVFEEHKHSSGQANVMMLKLRNA